MKKKTKLKLLSKILIFALLICNLYFPSGAYAASAETDFPGFGEAKSYGRGVFSAAVNGGAICYDKDGNPLMCFATQGGNFFACDLLTGKVVFEKKTTKTYIMAHLVKTASDGKVYIQYYPGNTFDVYDPKTGEYKEVYPGVSIRSQDGGNVTHDGKILLGSYYDTGACAYEYDIQTNTVKTYGPLDKNSHYIKGIDADENYIYAGTGVGEGNTKLYRINKSTGEQSVIYDFGGSIVYNVKVNSNYIIAQTGSGCYVIDKNNYSNFKLVGGSEPSDPSPYNENLFYTIDYSKWIYELNAETKEITPVNLSIPLDAYEEAEFAQWATLSNGDKVLGFRTNMMNKIGYFNPKTNEVVTHQLDRIADEGPNIQSMEISPEGVIYMGGYQTAMAAYDINKNEFLFKLQYWKQNEGVGFLNGKTYFGVYTDARLWRYDPKKNWNYKEYSGNGKYQGSSYNPVMVYDIEESQDRPFVVKGYNNKLYVGTMSGYNELGGALTIYSETSSGYPSAKTYRNVIPNQSITGVAVKDNLVYLSGTIRGGLGIEPIETQAKIAVFDTNTNTVVTEAFVPDLPIVGKTSQTIGEISFGPDGLLWGCSEKEGLVFAMDPETFEVKKYVSVNPGDDRGALARPLYLRWGSDGLLYTTAGWNVTVIDPDTMTYKTIAESCSLMTLDPYGDIWIARGSNFFKIEVSWFEKLQEILESIDFNNYESSTALGELKVLCASASLLTEESEDSEIISAIDAINAKKKELNDTSKYVSGFGAELDYLTQTVTITGNLKTGEEVSVRILSPEGKVVLLDQLSKNEKSFKKTYRISSLEVGEYKIYLDAKSYVKPVMRSVNSIPPDRRIIVNNKADEDSSGIVTTRLSNYFDVPMKLNFFTAEYYKQTDILKQATFETYTVNPGDFAIFKSQLGEGSDTDFKLFIWDENMAPVAAPFEN